MGVPAPVVLPGDQHVHTEWSWDAPGGSMAESCVRALELGLPAIAFTEHVDYVRWVIAPEVLATMTVQPSRVAPDGRFDPPPLDVDGYLACVEECRMRCPSLEILTGIELGEPHWFAGESRRLAHSGDFDRVLGSLHTVEVEGVHWLVTDLFEPFAPGGLGPHDVVRAYLGEALAMVLASTDFAVLAHVDYPLRAWPAEAGALRAGDFEEEFRAVLAALASAGRALEVNTVLPLPAEIVRWWAEAGGDALSFGSDAHAPGGVGHGFAQAAALAESCGFRSGRHPRDFWLR